ncbi:cell cycle transcriptional regulator TrcR [Brevundimonas sp. UBA7664]|uniref:cell cycle transcriptional regulator TrcR n=1 Tax=Brevundimonas sp. UBA7664 TaxID=1946141 RepID=UPI0025BE5A6C|nr:cell cycle transcriptional regulator TrcR [Brevundimonas sp. UBA7664]
MHSIFGKPIGVSTSEARGIAAWLVDNTALTFEQIAEFIGIARFEVKLIADDQMVPRPQTTDPVKSGWLNKDDIHRCEADATRSLSKPWAWISDTLTQAASASLRDAPIYGAQLTRLAFLTYGRNAWHSTWITRYYTAGSIGLTVGTLQSKAERLRTQGSVFKIDEMPALALQTEAATLFLVEVNRGRQLEALEEEVLAPLFSAGLLKKVADCPKNSLVCLQAPARINPPPMRGTRPFHQLRSSPQGANRSLGWSKTNLDLLSDMARFEKLQSHFSGLEDLTEKVWVASKHLPPEARLHPSKIEISTDADKRVLRWGEASYHLDV